MIVYLPMAGGVRTKVNIDKKKAWSMERHHGYPKPRWFEIELTEKMYQDALKIFQEKVNKLKPNIK